MDIIKIIKEVISEHYYEADKQRELEKFLIDATDFSEYFDYDIPDRLKLQKLYEVFLNDYAFLIKRWGVKMALLNWLQADPGPLNIPHSYHQIKNLMYSLGYDEVKSMDDDGYASFYYNEMTNIILKNQKDLQAV